MKKRVLQVLTVSAISCGVSIVLGIQPPPVATPIYDDVYELIQGSGSCVEETGTTVDCNGVDIDCTGITTVPEGFPCGVWITNKNWTNPNVTFADEGKDFDRLEHKLCGTNSVCISQRVGNGLSCLPSTMNFVTIQIAILNNENCPDDPDPTDPPQPNTP